MSRLTLFLILIACISSQGCKDVSDFFEHAFDEFDEAYCGVGIYDSRINQASDGKYLVIGSQSITPRTYPFFGIINRDGEQEISQLYEFDFDTQVFAATDLSNEYLIAGRIRKNSIDEYHQYDLFVARVDESGNMIWDKRYIMDPNVNDVEIFKLPNGHFMIISSLWYYTSGTNVSIIDENGTLLDSTNFSNYIRAIIKTKSGGYAYVSDNMLCQTDDEFSILNQWKTNTKYARLCQLDNGFAYLNRDTLEYIDGNGVIQWSYEFPGNVVCLHIVSKGESIYIFGSQIIDDPDYYDGRKENYIAEFDLHGTLVKEYDIRIGIIEDVILDSDQRIILLNHSGSCIYLDELK